MSFPHSFKFPLRRFNSTSLRLLIFLQVTWVSEQTLSLSLVGVPSVSSAVRRTALAAAQLARAERRRTGVRWRSGCSRGRRAVWSRVRAGLRVSLVSSDSEFCVPGVASLRRPARRAFTQSRSRPHPFRREGQMTHARHGRWRFHQVGGSNTRSRPRRVAPRAARCRPCAPRARRSRRGARHASSRPRGRGPRTAAPSDQGSFFFLSHSLSLKKRR